MYLSGKMYDAYLRGTGQEPKPKEPTDFNKLSHAAIESFRRLIMGKSKPVYPGSNFNALQASLHVQVSPGIERGSPIIIQPDIQASAVTMLPGRRLTLTRQLPVLHIHEEDYKDLIESIDPTFSRLQYHIDKIKAI